jgi:hypothetical protein
MPRRLWLAFAVPLLAFSQTPQAGALISGVLLERDAQTATGEFSLRNGDNQVFRYRFDGQTYVEREKEPIDVARLNPGDKIEVLSDRMPGILLRYALTIHVLPTAALPRPAAARRPRPSAGSEDRLIPAGNLSYSGVVFRVYSGRLVLRTRAGDRSIALRPDTRYMAEGALVEGAALKPNMRVFVRAGKSLYDEVEAYQIVWGSILQPR